MTHDRIIKQETPTQPGIMKNFKLCLWGLLLVLTSLLKVNAQTAVKPPGACISNEIIRSHLYFPDSIAGYNRSPRFDWAGVITSLTYKGHSYFGKWQDAYDATAHDAAMGPAEVFDPISFEIAKPGERFIKIGIGALLKPDNGAYDFMRRYTIVNHGRWHVKAQANQVSFTQVLQEGDYAYRYQKTIKLVPNQPVMQIIHTLKNLGKQGLKTSVYDHNFFVIDSAATGPGLAVIFPFQLAESSTIDTSYVRIHDGELQFIKELRNKFFSFPDLTHGKGAVYRIRMENQRTGAGVKIKGDRFVSKIAFWSSPKTVCPEPYIDINIAPGQETSWTLTYTFYTITQ